MPAKPCPSCGLKNPESSTTCDCGYHFGGPRLQNPGRLVCQSCGASSPPSATECSCGRAFAEDDDTEDARHMLTHRLTLGWLSIGGGVLMIVVAIGLAVVQVLLGSNQVLILTGALITGFALILKGSRMVSRARDGLVMLGAQPAAPPQARVVKK